MLEEARRAFGKRKEISFSLRGTTDAYHGRNLEEGVKGAKDGWFHHPIRAKSAEELLEKLREGVTLTYEYGRLRARESDDPFDRFLEPVIQVLDASGRTDTMKTLPKEKIMGAATIEQRELEQNGLKTHEWSERKRDLLVHRILDVLRKKA